jgi:trigger factor
LKVKQTYLDEHQLQVVVEADQDAFEKEKHKAAKELSKNKKIPGYRPGKAPYPLIVNHIGEGTIIDRALQSFLDEIYPEVLDEINGEPYGPGQLKEIQSLKPPIFEFIVPLQPEIELGEYHDLRIAYQESEVGEEEVDQVIERMLAQQSTIEEVDHPAEEGNLVDTEITGRPVDADPDDEDALIMANQPLPVMIKSEAEDDSKEWPFPGFSRQLLGVSPGDTLELSHEYEDEEHVDEELRGKEVLYTVDIERIRQRVLPDLDEEFLQSVSDAESVDEFKDQIRDQLVQQSEQQDEHAYFDQIFEELLDDATVKYPPQMVENEIDSEVQQISRRLESQGMDLQMYLDMQDMEEEDLREQIRPKAEERITRGLMLGTIAEEEDLDIEPEEVTEKFQEIVDDNFGPEDEEAREAFMNSRESMSLLNQLSSQMISQRTLDFLKALAKGEDVSRFKKAEEEGDGAETSGAAEEQGSSSVSEESEEDFPVEEDESEGEMLEEDEDENERGN